MAAPTRPSHESQNSNRWAPHLVDCTNPGVDAVHVAVHRLGQRRRGPLVQVVCSKALQRVQQKRKQSVGSNAVQDKGDRRQQGLRIVQMQAYGAA